MSILVSKHLDKHRKIFSPCSQDNLVDSHKFLNSPKIYQWYPWVSESTQSPHLLHSHLLPSEDSQALCLPINHTFFFSHKWGWFVKEDNLWGGKCPRARGEMKRHLGHEKRNRWTTVSHKFATISHNSKRKILFTGVSQNLMATIARIASIITGISWRLTTCQALGEAFYFSLVCSS